MNDHSYFFWFLSSFLQHISHHDPLMRGLRGGKPHHLSSVHIIIFNDMSSRPLVSALTSKVHGSRRGRFSPGQSGESEFELSAMASVCYACNGPGNELIEICALRQTAAQLK